MFFQKELASLLSGGMPFSMVTPHGNTDFSKFMPSQKIFPYFDPWITKRKRDNKLALVE